MSLLSRVQYELRGGLKDGPDCHVCGESVRPDHRQLVCESGPAHFRCYLFGRAMGWPLTERETNE